MKLLVFVAFIATVASTSHTRSKNWPWQVGKEYLYDINTTSWTKYDNSGSIGYAFKTELNIRAVASGKLIAKLIQPLYAQFQEEKIAHTAPSNLKYQPIQITDQPFEIFVEGGRIESFNVPLSLSVANENILRGLLSAFQVDLSTFGYVDSFPNSFDNHTLQGLFKKLETDVTGQCETLYTVSPVSAEWRRELPQFSSEEDPIEITKNKNYGSCKKQSAVALGIPDGAVWNGIATKNGEKQFLKHTTVSRLLAGKQGTILKSEVIDSVLVSPILFGKEKGEVYSNVNVLLKSIQETNCDEWKMTEASRQVESLLLFYTPSMFNLEPDKSIANAQKFLQDLTLMLENPNKLAKVDFISKFNVLVRILLTLDSNLLTELTNSVEITRKSKNIAESKMWAIYRDAIAQVGSDVTFEEAISWILTKKVQGEEAAQFISALSGSLLLPTKTHMVKLFDLALDPVVMEQKFLNTSILLAASKLLRHVEECTCVTRTVIPRFSKELKQAVENGDSNKAQVYIRVLGNLANPAILEVFAPYLDGTIAVTKYLRIQIVASLKTLANLKNEEVRAVLYSILKNTAEPYEVRVVAALNIFLAYPSAEMMQVMAHMTNDDPSTQVRAVLANSINFAAGLKDPRFTQLAKTAQSVQTFVSKEEFGYLTSTDRLTDVYTDEDDIAFFTELSYVNSKNHFLPKYFRAALRTRGTDLIEENQVTISLSDVQQLIESVAQLLLSSDKSNEEVKFSAKKVVELLNINHEPREPLEGSIFLENWDLQKLITFNEADLMNVITNTIENVEQLQKGIDVEYTKVLNHRRAFVVFPLATGVPFFFDYFEPFLLSIDGQIKVQNDANNKHLTGGLHTNLDMVYLRNIDGSIGFIDTLGDQYVILGVYNKILFNFPLNLNTELQLGQVKLNVKLSEQDTNFIHFAVLPYTTFQKLDCLLSVTENPSTKYIERTNKVISVATKLGTSTGVSIVLNADSYSTDYQDGSIFEDTDILTNIGTLLYQKDIAKTHFDLTYLAKESKNQDISLTFFYDTLFNQKKSGEWGPASTVQDSANSETRREEIVKRASAGIESADVQLYDLSVVFDGKQKVEYDFTAAIADSFVDNKLQGTVFLNGPEQYNAVFKVVKPKIAPLNFEEALKNEIKITYEADFKAGNEGNVHVQGFGERSKEYTEKLTKDPLAKQCLQDTSNDNTFQKDCFKMIVNAHAPDSFKFTVTYKNLDKFKLGSIAYYALQKRISSNQILSAFENSDDGKLEIDVQAYHYDNYVNYGFKTKYGVFNVNEKILGYFPYAAAVYAPITKWERAYNYYYGYQYLPYCAVDSSKVQTFSGRSYDYSLTSSWHVVMVDKSDDLGKWTDLVILARRPNNKQEEVYISYKTATAHFIELDIKPTAVEVKSNAQKLFDENLTTYWDGIEEAPLLQYYTLAEGVLVFNINNGRIRVVYDSQRLVIFTAEHRSTTRGICGQSTTQTGDDYLTPYGLVDRPEHYGASFSLEGEYSDPKTVELKKEAKLNAYQPVTKYTNILRSDAEWSIVKNQCN